MGEQRRDPAGAGPEALADRGELSAEEVAALTQHARELFNGETDAAFGDSVFNAALAQSQGFTSSDRGTGNYNQFWLVDRDFENRTSLIVDPPNGRVPPLTDAAQAAADAARAYRRDHPADSYTDRNNSDRCITYGVPRIRAGYNSYFQFVQTPDHLAVLKELIHDVRIIPIDGQPHLDDRIRQWMGDSRAHWDGDTLVVETTNYSPGRRSTSTLPPPTSFRAGTRAGITRVTFRTSRSSGRSSDGRSANPRCAVRPPSPRWSNRASLRAAGGCWAMSSSGSANVKSEVRTSSYRPADQPGWLAGEPGNSVPEAARPRCLAPRSVIMRPFAVRRRKPR